MKRLIAFFVFLRDLRVNHSQILPLDLVLACLGHEQRVTALGCDIV